MAIKSYIIIGVGNFGLSIIKTLSHANVELLVLDKNPKQLEEAAEYVTNTICADATDPDVLKGLGVKNFDGAIIAIGHNLDDRVIITMQLKEFGVPFVMAKAMNDLENRILLKVGADRTVMPEREMGIHIGNQIARGNLFSSIELTENYSIDELPILNNWGGKSIKDIGIRAKHGVSIIGIKRDSKLSINPDPDYVLTELDTLVVLGENTKIKNLRDKASK